MKYLEDLDRTELPKDMAIALPELETLDFIKTDQNVIMYGNPGTGKSLITGEINSCHDQIQKG